MWQTRDHGMFDRFASEFAVEGCWVMLQVRADFMHYMKAAVRSQFRAHDQYRNLHGTYVTAAWVLLPDAALEGLL